VSNIVHLLFFAIQYIDKCNEELKLCHSNVRTGIIDEEEVQHEVDEVNAWLEEARQELKLRKQIDALIQRATVTFTVKERKTRRRRKK
jgi:hypothetical protein